MRLCHVTLDGGIDEIHVEAALWPTRIAALTSVFAQGVADREEDQVQRFALLLASRKGCVGSIPVISRDADRGSRPGRNGRGSKRLARKEVAGSVHADDDGGDLEQGVAARVEPAGFDVDHDGKKAAEPLGVASRGSHIGHARSIADARATMNPNVSRARTLVANRA